jgi:hypothetical protein
MRKAIKQLGLVGLTLVAMATMARAQETTPVATASSEEAPHRRLQLGLAFLPMSLGRFTSVYGGMRIAADAAFAPGVGLSVGYDVFRGLTLGIAPQALFNVGTKEDPTMAGVPVVMSREFDLMARVAYAYQIVETIALYGEALPGFSLVMPSVGDVARGFVIGFGVGAMMDLGDRTYVNLAGGYQWGFQSRTADGVKTDAKTEYVRVALGVGWRF